MKFPISARAIRPPTSLNYASKLRPIVSQQRPYATQTSLGTTPQGPQRKRVTAFNDDGRVAWKDLSVGEKAGRATQQSFNFGLIMVGLVLTVRFLSRHRAFARPSETADSSSN